MRTRGAGQSALLLMDVVAVLKKERIAYAVIGALAASVHGTIRATTAADALVAASLSRLTSLDRVFAKAGFTTELRRGDAEGPIPALLMLGDGHGNRVDLLAGLRGLDPEALSRSITVPFLDGLLSIIGREDFIAMKCFAGGPQDLADAREALDFADGPVDLDLLRRISRRFGRSAADALENLLRA